MTDEMIADFEASVRAVDAKPLRTDELAKLAGFHDWYIVIYKTLTGPVHSKIRDVCSGPASLRMSGRCFFATCGICQTGSPDCKIST